ncbi:hypothetical protein CPC08DRAFT_713070 [Agrocybe pediades]|nr:hypothetical protein CPC08DRAFT_713070 [Agrocybe pediades]
MYLWGNEYILSSNVLTATTVLLFYDYVLTFADEVNIIWKNPYKWTNTTLFFLNRYLPFSDTLISLYITMSVMTPEKCYRYYSCLTWLIAIGLMVSELILLLRTWALLGKAKWLTCFLLFIAAGTFIPGIVITIQEIESLIFKAVPLGGLGCNLVQSSRVIVAAYSLIGVSETVVVCFTIGKGKSFIRTKTPKQSWVSHIYRDGLFFYFYLLSITIVNIIVPLAAAQPRFRNYLAVPQRVFHSIFCTRVLLHIEAGREGLEERELIAVPPNPRSGSLSKTNFTGNILDSVSRSNISRDIEFQSDLGEIAHELDSYSRDWTRT